MMALLAGLLLLALAAPSALSADVGNQDCIQGAAVSATAQLYPASWQIRSSTTSLVSAGVTKVTVATDFEVTYYPSFKVVTNTYLGESYLLYPCGISPPSTSQYTEIPKDIKVFKVPLQLVAVGDTTVLPFLKALDVRGRIKYAPANSVDACMQALVDPDGCGRVADALTNTGVDARFTGYDMNATDPLAVTFTATADPGALNRAEYIKYVATFFNKERQANTIFDAVVQRYNDLKAKVAALPLSSKPLVAWLYYQPDYCATFEYDGCKEHFTLYNNAYRRDFLQDAGGLMLDMAALHAKYAVGKLNASVVLTAGGNLELYDVKKTLPLLREILKGVQVVVDETSYNTVVRNVTVQKKPTQIMLTDFLGQYGFATADLSDPDYPFLTLGNVLRLDGQANAAGDIGWFEDAVAQPDVVLQDFVLALTPAALTGTNAAPTFVRAFGTDNVNRVTVLAPGSCPLQGCQLPTSVICPTVYKACDGSVAYTTAETAPCAPTCPPATNVGGGGAAGAARSASPLALLLSALGAAALLRALL